MKKIAIIEPGIKNHTPIIVNWAKICDLKGWKLTVYTTKECFQLVEKDLNSTKSFVTVKFIETLPIKALFKYIRDLRGFDQVIIASLYGNYLPYLFLCFFCRNFSLTVHNINKWFIHKKINEGFFQRSKSIISFLLRRVIIKNINTIIVNSNNQKDYLESAYSFKKIVVIPFKMDFIIGKTKKSFKISVVYPGIISLERKKYSEFLLLAKSYPNVDFILLGELTKNEAGKYILKEIETKNLKNIVFFREYVSHECFDSYMKEAHLIFSNINVYSGIEVYGKTKDSGASYLMAEYALPFLVNKEFENLACLNPATSYYEDEKSLIKIFETLITQPMAIEEKVNLILSARKEMSLEYVCNNFKGFS